MFCLKKCWFSIFAEISTYLFKIRWFSQNGPQNALKLDIIASGINTFTLRNGLFIPSWKKWCRDKIFGVVKVHFCICIWNTTSCFHFLPDGCFKHVIKLELGNFIKVYIKICFSCILPWNDHFWVKQEAHLCYKRKDLQVFGNPGVLFWH